MLNRIDVMGRLTRKPEVRYTKAEEQVVSFTIACERDYGGKENRVVDYIDCVAWKNNAEFIGKNFKRGDMIVVGGRLQLRSWTDKQGHNRRSAEVLVDHAYFGGSKAKDADEATAEAEPSFAELIDDDGETELPF